LYELTGESRTGSHPYAIAFTYDNVGNRLSQTRDGVTTGYQYNDRDQLTTETVAGASTTYAYDRAGRMVSKTDASGTTTYGWLDNDRMVSVTGPGVAVAYEYDHQGRRVQETTAAGTKR
jgi:YD repeat-containing protein